MLHSKTSRRLELFQSKYRAAMLLVQSEMNQVATVPMLGWRDNHVSPN